MTLTRIEFNQFAAFQKLVAPLNPGINLFIGSYNTGKSQLLKAAYSACRTSNPGVRPVQELLDNFLPYRDDVTRLLKTEGGKKTPTDKGFMKVNRYNQCLRISVGYEKTTCSGIKKWQSEPFKAVFIGETEMLGHANGFLSLAAQRDISFEKACSDILHQAYLPKLRKLERWRTTIMKMIQKEIDGTVFIRGETFFLKSSKDQHIEIEFSLLSKRTKNLGLLWLLIQNGLLARGSVLLLDGLETGQPFEVFEFARILLALQREGVQILIATANSNVVDAFYRVLEVGDQVTAQTLHRVGNQIVAGHPAGIKPPPNRSVSEPIIFSKRGIRV